MSLRLPLLLALALVGLPLSAATAQTLSGGAFTPTLPGEAPVVDALDGNCPVCIVEMKKWMKGDPRFTSVVDGKRYSFPDAKAKAMFDADPAKYVPAAGGDCVVCRVEAGKRAPGSPKFAATYQGRVYLFPGPDQKKMFLDNPAKYADADLAYGGQCSVCKVEMGADAPGKAEHTAIHGGKRYQFPSEKEKAMFLANPAKYAEPNAG